MKKIYMLLGALMLTVTSTAQFVHQSTTAQRAFAERGNISSGSVVLPENRVTIFEDDVDDCSMYIIENALDNGYTEFVDLQWECGDAVPEGPAAIDALLSTTADNGYLLVDSDEYGGEEGGTGIENCWVVVDSIFDLTDYDYVSLAFETYYYMWDGGSSDGNEYCLVEFSTDGGMTWPDPTTYEEEDAPGLRYELWPDMGTQDPVDNPTIKLFEVTEGVANESEVMMRFRWKGTWGYSWMIDDIELFETPENDLTIVKSYNGNIETDYNYHTYPMSQTKEMTFGGVMLNNSYTDQVDVEVSFEVSGAETSSLSTLYSLESGQDDTLWYDTGWEPATLGMYTVDMSVPDDDFMEGNMSQNTFELDQWIYGHNTPDNLVQRGYDQDYEYSIGNVYYMEEDAMLGALNIYFTDNTVLADGETFEINVYVVGESIQDLSNVGSAEIDANDLVIGDYANYSFGEHAGGDGAIELFAGNGYVVEVRKFFGDSRIYVASNVLDEDFSTVNYGPFGVDDAENWFVGWGWTPAVRMNLDESETVEEQTIASSFTLGQNIPNPATDETRINYTLNAANTVVFKVVDMMGREVLELNEGTQSAGEHVIEIDTNAMSAGVYTYTMIVGGESLTKQLIVK